METQDMAYAANPRQKANCDQEAVLKDRIRTVIDMVLAINKRKYVGADEPIANGAIEGLVNGAAIEIIRTLGMEPAFINLRQEAPKTSSSDSLGVLMRSSSWR